MTKQTIFCFSAASGILHEDLRVSVVAGDKFPIKALL
jgi:hypothetical protein